MDIKSLTLIPLALLLLGTSSSEGLFRSARTRQNQSQSIDGNDQNAEQSTSSKRPSLMERLRLKAAARKQAQSQPSVEEETDPGDYSELFATEEDQNASGQDEPSTKLTRKQKKALRKQQKREQAERENQERLNRLEANRPSEEEEPSVLDEDENSTEVNADEDSDSENVSEIQKDKKKDKKLKKDKKR